MPPVTPPEMRLARPEDAAAMRAFLAQHLETSMFLLGNLEAHGIGASEHRNATTYWLLETGNLGGVFGLTRAGFIMCQRPGLTRAEAEGFVRHLTGRVLQGITGDVAQVEQIIAALPLPDTVWHSNRAEPLFRRDMTGLAAQPLRAAKAADRALLKAWFRLYLVETGLSDAAGAAREAPRHASRAIGGAVRLLLENGAPVAMASINAKAGPAVQVGGVFVPPEHRGRGLGGRVTEGLLAEQAAQGAALALLFAASQMAAKAYERMGFQRAGSYKIAMLRAPTCL